MNELKKNVKMLNKKYFSVARILSLGFLLLVVVGAILLCLPISLKTPNHITFIDALFTSTSAVCVTGLSTISIYDTFTTFGKFIIICLIQIGGLGFMTFVTLLYYIINKKITLKNEMIIEEESNAMINYSNTLKILLEIIKFTFSIEIIGGILLSIIFIKDYGFLTGIAKAFFISISSFCNAGFDTIGDTSLIPYQCNYIVNLITIILIHLGGIGFYVFLDIYNKFLDGKSKKLSFKNICKKLSVHTKIVISTTIILILFGTLTIFTLESFNPNTMADKNVFDRLIISFFQAVASRSAGFKTIELSNMFESTKLIYMILMLVGGSPTGTAGGIKTTTIALLILTLFSVLKNESSTTAFGKTIPSDIIRKAIVLFFTSVFYIIFATLLLITFERCSITDGIFEIISAFSTVGSTLGLTNYLTIFGKIILICTMFVGRVGILNLATSMMSNQYNKPKDIIKYPEERVLLG